MPDEPQKPDTDDELTRSFPGGCSDETPTGSISEALAGSIVPQQPATISGYRVIGKLGEGGMGIVWEAEQERPKRRVALKVMRREHRVDELHARMFHREAESLARLKHPNIAAIYESGHTEDGHDYFAMELVRGVTLDAWLKGRPETIDSTELELRLKLFRDLCNAVHYAHQRGVIHRDLKPSNVIVTEETHSAAGTVPGAGTPSVKILDFGLARIADSDIAATTVSEIGVIKGTLQYMSPEQARGDVEAIDLRSDVYGLGVILYEMLTGQRPYDVSLSALAEAVRVICEEPPRPLSRHWSGTRRLDSDLETIVGKALEKDIDCRYGSAAALGEDMDRYLASQPIQARPPSAAYQLKKMVQRNRLGAAFVATVLALLVGFGVTMAAQARRIAAERDRAELVSDFMLELFAFSDTGETRGEEVTAREILDRGVERVEADLAGDPVTQGRLMETMGDVYRNLGLYEPATRLLEGALERSIENTGTTSFDTARIQMGLAWLLVHDAQFERAEEIERQAIETLRARGDQPLYLASALNNLVFGFLRRGGRLPEESLAFLDEALEIQIKYLGEENAEVAGTIFHKAWALSRTGRREEAAAMFRQTIDMQRRIYEGDYPSIAWALNNLSAQETALGNPETGLALATEALEMNHRLFGEFHPEIGFNLKRQADAYQAMHNHQAAAEALRLALEVDRRTLPADHPRIASTLNNLVAVLWNLGDITDARVYLEEAMELSRARRGDDHPSNGVYLNNLAELDLALGDVDSAYERLNRALEIIRSSRGENHSSTIYARGNLARVYRYRGDLEKAEALNLQALEILASQPEHQLQGPLHRQLAEVYLDQGRLDEALAESELAVQIMSEDNATVDWELAVTRNIHGDCLSRTGDLETAGPVLAESTEIIVTTAPGETFGREASGRLAAHRDRAR